MAPARKIAAISSVVATGRSMKGREISTAVIASRSLRRGFFDRVRLGGRALTSDFLRRIGSAREHDLRAVAQLVDAFDDDAQAGLDAFLDHHALAIAGAEANRPDDDLVVGVDRIDERPLPPRWIAAAGARVTPLNVSTVNSALTN